MTLSYRRQSLDRDTTFYIPKVECFACYDSGIVTNGDAAINQYIPDYDRTADGKINGGQDLAIICHCKAAYADYESSTNKEKQGFRESNGQVKTTETLRGDPQPIGITMEKEKIRQIHLNRQAAWKNTCQEMNELRKKKINGEKVETPYYIQVVKENLSNIGNMFSFTSEKAILESMKESNDKN